MRSRWMVYVSVVLALLATVPVTRAQVAQTYINVAPFVCRVTAITATTQCQAAPSPTGTGGSRVLVTDVVFSNNVGTAQTVKLVTGTGTNCGTGTADLTHAVQFPAAVGNFAHSFLTPPPPPSWAAVCVTPSAATSVSATLTGFVGP
jgi:hypothetical protein